MYKIEENKEFFSYYRGLISKDTCVWYKIV